MERFVRVIPDQAVWLLLAALALTLLATSQLNQRFTVLSSYCRPQAGTPGIFINRIKHLVEPLAPLLLVRFSAVAFLQSKPVVQSGHQRQLNGCWASADSFYYYLWRFGLWIDAVFGECSYVLA